SSRTAMHRASALSDDTRQDRIHMEHLIAGLWLKDDGPTRRLFTAHDIKTSHDLLAVIFEAVESTMSVEKIAAQSWLKTGWEGHSSHAFEALWAGRAIAGANAQIQSRHLLYGALSVEECDVVKAFLKRGIRKEEIDLTAPSSKAGND